MNVRQSLKCACAALALTLAGCATEPPREPTEAEVKQFVAIIDSYIDSVAEACVTKVETGKSIEMLYGASGTYSRQSDTAKRMAAGLSKDTIVWTHTQSQDVVTIMEDPKSCTVGALGLPAATLKMTSDVLVQSKGFSEAVVTQKPGSSSIVYGHSKMVDGRELTVVLIGITGFGAPTLMTTVGWKDEK